MHQPNETHAIHRGSGRRTILVALATVAFVAVVIVKPWGGSIPTFAPSASPAVVALAQAAAADTPQPSDPLEAQSPTSTAVPRTAQPTFGIARPVEGGPLDPGTYDDLFVDGQGFSVRFTVPAGWSWSGRSLSKGDVGMPDGAAIFFFGGRVQVYADPCHWAGPQSNPPTGDGASALMNALAAQPVRNSTSPVDRPTNALRGFNPLTGMAIELTVPANLRLASCDQSQFRSWGPDDLARSHQGPGQRDLVWAVDVPNGVGAQRLIVDAASFVGTPAEVMSEIETILGSIYVGHWG